MLDRSQTGSGDACHCQKLLAERKPNGSYRTSFLPAALSNLMVIMYYFWYKLYHSSFWPIGEQPLSYAFIWIQSCQLAQELRSTDQGTVRRRQPVTHGVGFSPDLVSEHEVLGRNPVASKDAQNTTDPRSLVETFEKVICQAWKSRA